MKPLRILVTGSRAWRDRDAVFHALLAAWAETDRAPLTVVHGAARGADSIANEWAETMRGLGHAVTAERYPARRFPSPRTRNQHMVNLGALICLSFAQRWDSGTGMCARMARRAGIPVVDVGVPTGPEDRPVAVHEADAR